MLRAGKGGDSSFPFTDSHDKTYNVRDNSDWETTLNPRLRERLRNSKNVVLLFYFAFKTMFVIQSHEVRENTLDVSWS